MRCCSSFDISMGLFDAFIDPCYGYMDTNSCEAQVNTVMDVVSFPVGCLESKIIMADRKDQLIMDSLKFISYDTI